MTPVPLTIEALRDGGYIVTPRHFDGVACTPVFASTSLAEALDCVVKHFNPLVADGVTFVDAKYDERLGEAIRIRTNR